MNTLIVILSAQLIPNLLFIRQFRKEGDQLIFLSSEDMELKSKSKILANALKLKDEEYTTLTLLPNDIPDNLEKLKTFVWPQSDQYLVSITGGTKLMSHAVHQYFVEKEDAEIYYNHIGEKFIRKVFPDNEKISFDTHVQLDLKTYFLAHGYEYICENHTTFPFEVINQLMKKVVKNKGSEQVEEILNAQKFDDDVYKRYYSGGWFEEWMYLLIKRELKLNDQQIAFNLKIKNHESKKKTENDNEIDVAFVYNNILYLIECKVFKTATLKANKISNSVYALASYRQNLGLQATGIVAILAFFGNSLDRKNHVADISKVMNIRKIFSAEDMLDKNTFVNQLKIIVEA